MFTAWPVVCFVQVDSSGSGQGHVKHWKEMPLRQAMSMWKLLIDEVRRPRFPREHLLRKVVDMTPSVPVDLDLDLFTKNLRSARRRVLRVGHQE